MQSPLTLARISSLNLAQRINWGSRFPRVVDFMTGELRSSVYLLQETDFWMAVQLAKALGWTGSEGEPCFRVDENRNCVIWDPKKWRDLSSRAESLTAARGDLGDRHFRSVQWVQLEHRTLGRVVWFGSAHLSNGDAGAERATQARVLGMTAPAGLCVLGIDRNSRASSEPTKVLESFGLVDSTRGVSRLRSYPAGDTRTDEVQIDAIFTKGVLLANTMLLEPRGATDHRAWRTTVCVPAAGV